jgi:hypothetical protein
MYIYDNISLNSYYNDLRVQERNSVILSFSLKSPGKRTPSRFPNRDPMGREAFYIPLKNLIFRVPQYKSPPSRSPSWNPSQRDAPPLSPPSFIYQSPRSTSPPTYQVPLGQINVDCPGGAHMSPTGHDCLNLIMIKAGEMEALKITYQVI